MKYKKITAMCLCVAMAGMSLVGCTKSDTDNNQTEESSQKSSQESSDTNSESEESNVTLEKFDVNVEFDEADLTDTYENVNSQITLKDDGSSADGDGVEISGNTITIVKAGTYVLAGELTNGQVQVDVEEKGKVQLVFNGVTIKNSTTSPLFVKNAQKTVITLPDGTTNELGDGENYEFEDSQNQEPNSTIFSKDDLTLNGKGTLKVTSSYNNAIRCKDELKIVDGNYEISAVNNGISGKDFVAIKDGTFKITSTGDGIKANNTSDTTLGYIYIENGTYDITAQCDGIQATTCVRIVDGDFTVQTGGGSANGSTKSQEQNFGRKMMEQEEQTEESTVSCKGIKAGADITVEGGKYNMDTADDAFHSNGSINVKDGSLTIATGDDGIHADTDVILDNGTIKVTKSYEGIEGCTITVNGGDIEVTSSDDGFNAAGGNDSSATGGGWGKDQFATDPDASITFNGGTTKVDASGDGIDSNGIMSFNGGQVYVDGPTNDGNTAIDSNGTIAMNGGTVVAAGSSGMLESPSDESKQNVFVITYASGQAAGTKVTVKDAEGKEVCSYTPSKQFAAVILSSGDLQTDETYTVYTGDEKTGEIKISQSVMNLSSDGTVTAGAQSGGMGGKGGGMKGADGGVKGNRRQDAGSSTQGEMPSGEMPNGEMPNGEMPNGEMPSGGMPDEQAPVAPSDENASGATSSRSGSTL